MRMLPIGPKLKNVAFFVILRFASSKTENERCDVTQALSECHILAEKLSVQTTLLRPAYHLSIERLSRYTYRLLNRSASQTPFVQFEIPRHVSILRSVYPPTTVKDDRTLFAQLVRRDREWILHVEGELQSCPGQLYFEFLLIKEPSKDRKQLGDYKSEF